MGVWVRPALLERAVFVLQVDRLCDVVNAWGGRRREGNPTRAAMVADAVLHDTLAEDVAEAVVELNDAAGAVVCAVVFPVRVVADLQRAVIARPHRSDIRAAAAELDNVPLAPPLRPLAASGRNMDNTKGALPCGTRRWRAVRHRCGTDLGGQLAAVNHLQPLDALALLREQQPSAQRNVTPPRHHADTHIARAECSAKVQLSPQRAAAAPQACLENHPVATAHRCPCLIIVRRVDAKAGHVLIFARVAAPGDDDPR
mmetsp:Transcript_6221/g.13536  ORF Transcript_6221/g.13536 Transcript_6221/m.13536 type:complete len:257 (+) Transcript_6221:398-1168(+)